MPLYELLNNLTLQEPEEPVALFFSYVDTDRYDYYCQNREDLINLHSPHRNHLVKFLSDRNYTVVADDSPLSVHPGTIVVSHSGIQTPFLEPSTAQDFGYNLLKIIDSSGFVRPLSAVLGIRLQQLSSPIIYPQTRPGNFKYLKHPDGRFHDYVRYRYGTDFIDKMYKRAWSNGEDIASMLKQEPCATNTDEELYSGRQLLLDTMASHPRNNLEGRAIVFATLSYKNAARYAKDRGFIHHFKKANGQLYYDDYFIEMGRMPSDDPQAQVETMVVPGKNMYVGADIYMTTRYYKIPLEEELWSVFAEYHRAAYIPDTRELENRRLNLLWDAKCNGNQANTYMPLGVSAEELSIERYLLRPNLDLEDVLVTPQSVARKDYQKYLNSVQGMKEKVHEMKSQVCSKEQGKDICLTPKNRKSVLTKEKEL